MNKNVRPASDLGATWREAWRSPDRRTPWAWAEEHIGSIPYSPIPGRFRSDNSPQIREPLEAIVDPKVRIVFMAIGIALDIGVFEEGRYVEESAEYKMEGALGKQLGLKWGGDWKSIQDEPHFELCPSWARELSEGGMLAELRRRNSQSIPVFSA